MSSKGNSSEIPPGYKIWFHQRHTPFEPCWRCEGPDGYENKSSSEDVGRQWLIMCAWNHYRGLKISPVELSVD